MKSLLKYVAAVALCVGLYMPDALALDAVPHGINIQGVLRNVGGEVVTGTYSMRFVIYDAVAGGNTLCQNIASITVTGGVFNTSVTCPATAFVNRTAAYLGITVNPDAELSRIPLTSVGFAIQAEHAEQADELLGPAPDLACTRPEGCVGALEVAFNYAASDSKGGPATDVNCYGCVSGGAPGDIAAGSITSANIGALEVKTGNIDNASITNAKLASNSVYTGNITDGQVGTPDLANGAVISTKIASGAVGDTQLGVNWALGATKGGDAAGVTCSGCVDNNDIGVAYAAGVDASGVPMKNGAASGLNCVASPCVDAAEVTFGYAASSTQGGAASDVNCTDCVGSGEVQFNYAASASENGEASGLICTGCVGTNDMGVNYADSGSKGGPAKDLLCSRTDSLPCVSTGEVDFNWAASATKGGAANNLDCVGCVASGDIADGTVVNLDISGPITGSKITTATATDLGVVKIGSGIAISSGSITPDWALVAAKSHVHDGYFENALDNLEIGNGKYITFLDPGDNPGSYQAKMAETTAESNSAAGVTLFLGAAAATPDASYFEIAAESGISGRKHLFTTGGNAYHSGNLQFDGNLICKAAGCVDSTQIVNNTVTGTDILDQTITGADLAGNLALTTTGRVTADEVWAKRFVDSNASTWYVDPNLTSYLNITRTNEVIYNTNPVYGLKNTGTGFALYTKSVDTGATGETLFMNSNTCAQVDMFNIADPLCANKILTVHGVMHAKRLYDEDNGSYYVDPAAHTMLNSLQTATSEIPRTGTAVNYINGTTYAFNGTWYDANSTGYYVDPNNTSVYNVINANGFRTSSWPGDPAGGNGQFAGDGAQVYINPPAAGAGDIYMRNEGANKIVFALESNARTSLPSFRTNGHHLVINPGVSDPNLYLNLDVGGANRFYGSTYAYSVIDLASPTCVMDAGNTSNAYEIYSQYISTYYLRVHQGLRVDGTNGIFVVGNGDWGTGIRMNGNTTVTPAGDNAGAVGMSSRRFAFMYSVNSVWTSERKAKKDIRYLNDRDMGAIGAAIQQIKPATWLYNEETAKTAATPETDEMRVRNVPHVGAILDEMPDIITNGGQGWYANDSVGFLLVASKYLDDKINRQTQTIHDLEDRIAVMEQVLVDAGLYQ